LKDSLGDTCPRVFLILGNDDPAYTEEDLAAGEVEGLWEYVHGKKTTWGDCDVRGYNCVPPTPFLLKDWERYDVSRYVDPGCVSPEEGRRSDGLSGREIRWATIEGDLAGFAGDADQSRTIWLFHTPPHGTGLDLVDQGGKMVDHVPLDPQVGSIAVKRFIEERQPLITLHGHIHETVRMSGRWRETIGRTQAFAGAHHGPEMALVRFDPTDPAAATREIIPES
jgi:Icc-related predicted phosphoesterase